MNTGNETTASAKRTMDAPGPVDQAQKKSRTAAAEAIVKTQLAIPIKSDYSKFGKLDRKTQSQLNGVDPYTQGKGTKFQDNEKQQAQESMYLNLQAEMDELIPMALKDQETAERHATIQQDTVPILEAVIGGEPARSCIYASVRHHFGPNLSDGDKQFLLENVFDGDKNHFDVEERAYSNTKPRSKPVQLDKEDIFRLVHKQLEYYAVPIEQKEKAIRANSLTKEFLLSLRALSGTEDKSSSDFKALVLGLVLHHLNGVPGTFNGIPFAEHAPPEDANAVPKDGHATI